MAPEGVELLIGVVGDPRFGPLVAVEAGGATAELVGDVQVRLAPLGRREARAMPRWLRTVVVDARVRVEPPAPPRPYAVLDR